MITIRFDCGAGTWLKCATINPREKELSAKMQSGKQQKIPDVLCPFYERACPLGERTALVCWQLFKGGDDMLVDYEEYEVDCDIARWMFSPGTRFC